MELFNIWLVLNANSENSTSQLFALPFKKYYLKSWIAQIVDKAKGNALGKGKLFDVTKRVIPIISEHRS